jgi:hypothetical protein
VVHVPICAAPLWCESMPNTTSAAVMDDVCVISSGPLGERLLNGA